MLSEEAQKQRQEQIQEPEIQQAVETVADPYKAAVIDLDDQA